MHANRNKSALHRIEKGMMRANRTRNTFAVLAIILTTFMITTIFSLGINYKENMDLSSVRTAGTTANAILSTPSPQQVEKIRALDYVESVGEQIAVGSVTQQNSEGRALQIALMYHDASEWEKHDQGAISEINGNYPAAENEIMLSLDALDQLGIPSPSIGMEIPLTYAGRNGEQQQTFSLSGWFRSYTGTGLALVSQSFCNESGCTLQESGMLSLTLKEVPSDFYRLQDDIAVDKDAGQSLTGLFTADMGMGSFAAVVILLVLFIIGSGCLLIYNILYISVTRDTRFYGLLKTIGTSPSQLRKIVRGQAFRFACIGIPIGLLLATAVSFVLIPWILNSGFITGISSMDAKMFFHPAIFIGAVLFSAATVWVSCNAPARAAAKISPVEALRFQNFSPKKTGPRHSRHGGKLSVMAFHNVFRDKKRAVLVFLSLFLGTISILGVNGIFGSISAEGYISKYVNYDFEFCDTRFTNQSATLGQETPQFDQHFVDQISALDTTGDVIVNRAAWVRLDVQSPEMQNYLRTYYEQDHLEEQGLSFDQFLQSLQQYLEMGAYGCYASTIDERYVQAYNEAHPDSPVDLDAFRRGETALIGLEGENWSVNDTLVGKTLALTPDGSEPVSFRIDASLKSDDYPQNALIASRESIGMVAPQCLFVSEAGMARLADNPIIYDIGINARQPEQRPQLETQLQALRDTLTGDSIGFQSVLSTEDEWNASMYSLNVMASGVSILLILIGLINFVNVMLTSVVARRNELAILESVGMTKKQIMKMLTWEGGYYALISSGLILTLGNGFLYLVAQAVPNIADYAQFTYPYTLVVGLIAAFTIICLTVPLIVFRTISRETVTERLHAFEN